MAAINSSDELFDTFITSQGIIMGPTVGESYVLNYLGHACYDLLNKSYERKFEWNQKKYNLQKNSDTCKRMLTNIAKMYNCSRL